MIAKESGIAKAFGKIVALQEDKDLDEIGRDVGTYEIIEEFKNLRSLNSILTCGGSIP